MVRRSPRGSGYNRLEHALQQADDSERIWRRSKIRFARRRLSTLDRGISGRHLQTPDRRAPQDPVPARHKPMDPERFSLTASAVAGHPGWLQPQGTYFRKWRAKESVLRSSEVLSRAGGAN